MFTISFIDTLLKILYSFGDTCIDNAKKQYSKENIESYGKEHGFSDDHINKVYNNLQDTLYDAEDFLDNIKDTVEDCIDYYKNKDSH